MQICGQDAFPIKFSSSLCHDTVSYYDTTVTSLLLNYCATSDFCLCGMHDTGYDTTIVASLSHPKHSFWHNDYAIKVIKDANVKFVRDI
jgi:hypothetical protein